MDFPRAVSAASAPAAVSRTTGELPRVASAPLLKAGAAPFAATWYPGSGKPHSRGVGCGASGTGFRPLGSAWRDSQESRGDLGTTGLSKTGSLFGGAGLLEELRSYSTGCVPHWRKEGRMRVKGAIEHELTWAYYRMRHTEDHPERKRIGEFLPQDALCEKMRFGVGSRFMFWRDLRPPFSIQEVKVSGGVMESPSSTEKSVTGLPALDGEVFSAVYECPIEYAAERLMDMNSDAGTFNNKIRGVAQVHMPPCFPKRAMTIVSWGSPTLITGGGLPGQEDPAAARPDRSGPDSGAGSRQRRHQMFTHAAGLISYNG